MTASPRTLTHEDCLFIGGQWTPAHGPEHEVISPATEQVVATVNYASADDVDAAVAAARAAWPAWAASTVADRCAILRALAEHLESNADEFARIIEAEHGSPSALARKLHVEVPIQVIRATADALESFEFETQVGNSTILRESVGVVAAITPWNLPLHQVVAKVIPAIAAGATVVLKPASLTPLSAYALARALQQVGLPAGVFNVIVGDGRVVGESLAAHRGVDLVSFTGSTAVGHRIAELAARNLSRVTLELGGKSASVVLPDADEAQLAAAVKVTLANCFLNAGQTCTALSRLVVPRDRLATVEALAADAAKKYVPGSSRLGPVISAAQRDSVQSFLTDSALSGAKVVYRGSAEELPATGFYVAPAVVSQISSDHKLAQEEIFGPVLAILAYDDLADAERIANDSSYGLSGAVWGPGDSATAFARRMRTGMVDVNGAAFNASAPFGGYKQSGYGRELGAFGIADCLQVKAVQS